MKYVVDDKKLNAATFIAFVNQVWQGSYDVEKTQGASTYQDDSFALGQ